MELFDVEFVTVDDPAVVFFVVDWFKLGVSDSRCRRTAAGIDVDPVFFVASSPEMVASVLVVGVAVELWAVVFCAAEFSSVEFFPPDVPAVVFAVKFTAVKFFVVAFLAVAFLRVEFFMVELLALVVDDTLCSAAPPPTLVSFGLFILVSYTPGSVVVVDDVAKCALVVVTVVVTFDETLAMVTFSDVPSGRSPSLPDTSSVAVSASPASSSLLALVFVPPSVALPLEVVVVVVRLPRSTGGGGAEYGASLFTSSAYEHVSSES